MNARQELAELLEGWAEASAQVESVPTETCLTAAQICDFVDDELAADERERAAIHLSQCSFCAREVGSLYRAAREFDDRVRMNTALGSLRDRVGACVRVFVDEARGAFTRADALLHGMTASLQLRPVFAPPALGLVGTRGDDDAAEDGGDPEAVHEVSLYADGLPGTEILCGEEEGGSVVVSMEEPWEVRLVAPDGTAYPLEVEAGDDRFYAMVTGMPPGDYLLAIVRPEEGEG